MIDDHQSCYLTLHFLVKMGCDDVFQVFAVVIIDFSCGSGRARFFNDLPKSRVHPEMFDNIGLFHPVSSREILKESKSC